MYDVLTSQFNEALTREGNTVTDSTGTTSYKCLFRKNSDKNSSDNRLTIFYSVSEAITQGQLLKYKGRYFLILNQETIENDTYQKSDLLETNTEIYTIIRDSSSGTGYELNLRAYSEDLTSVGLTGDSQISIVGGNISLMTQDNADSRKLAINATFTALGATWKIINLYYKNGLCYIFTERTADSTTTPVYSLAIVSADTYTEGDTGTATTTATITDGSTVTNILNATINWSSSDMSVATVDNSGHITTLKSGTFVLTATWVEHGTIATKTVTVSSNVSYTAAITPNYKEIGTGRGYTFTVTFTDSSGAAVTLTPVWSFTMDTQDATLLSGITLTYPASNTCRVGVANNDDLVGYTVTLHVKDSNNLCSATATIVLT